MWPHALARRSVVRLCALPAGSTDRDHNQDRPGEAAEPGKRDEREGFAKSSVRGNIRTDDCIGRDKRYRQSQQEHAAHKQRTAASAATNSGHIAKGRDSGLNLLPEFSGDPVGVVEPVDAADQG